jgi:predicted aspartyl protease
VAQPRPVFPAPCRLFRSISDISSRDQSLQSYAGATILGVEHRGDRSSARTSARAATATEVSAVRHLILFAGRAILIFGTISMSCLHAQDAGKATATTTMPFELISGFLVVVDGYIGNLDGFKFILDTGATHSLIDRKVADRLHLKRRSGEVISFDRYIPMDWAIIPELRVGPLRAETLQVMVVKLAEYSDLAEHADGIIGLDLLSQSKKFTIDYEAKTVSLQLAVGTTGRSSASCFVTPLVVQGLQVNLAVDTGLQGIVLYKNRLRKGLPKMRIEGESINVAMGRLRGTQIRLAGVRIADAEVASTAILIDGPNDKTLPDVDGYLGPSTLQAKRIEFDFDAKVLRWWH